MYQPLSLFIGLRYSQAKRRNHYISFVSLISLLGMILGVVALIVVVCVMNGFEAEMRGRILSLVPHGYLKGQSGQLENWPQWANTVQQHKALRGAAPYIKGNVMLSRPGMVRAAQLHAIDPAHEQRISQIGASMVDGSINELNAGAYNIVVGQLLARFLGIYVGDDISVILPRVTVTPLGIFPRVKRFHVVGIFQVGAQLDSNTVLIHLQDGQKLFQLGDSVNGLRLQLHDLFNAEQVLSELLPLMPQGTTAIGWSQTQGSLFRAVKMEKRMVSLLLLIIVAIAAFNIVSILTIMVADKRPDIAVLRTMGATPSSIMWVFIIQGLSVGLAGIVIGVALGVPIAINAGRIVAMLESVLGAQVFNPQVFYPCVRAARARLPRWSVLAADEGLPRGPGWAPRAPTSMRATRVRRARESRAAIARGSVPLGRGPAPARPGVLAGAPTLMPDSPGWGLLRLSVGECWWVPSAACVLSGVLCRSPRRYR